MTKTVIGPVLSLTIVEYDKQKCIAIEVKNKDRLTQHGFGIFLENVKPKEVIATKEAIDALLAQPERRGLQGMDFWQDNRMAFCASVIPLTDISVPTGAKTWIKNFEQG